MRDLDSLGVAEQAPRRRGVLGGRWRMPVSIAVSGAIVGALALVVSEHYPALRRAWSHAPALSLALVVGLAVIALLARTEAVVHSLDAIGERPRRSTIHSANALTFLALTINHFVASPVRAWLLKPLDRQRALSVPQMLLVDASMTLIEGVCVVLLVIISASTLSLPWWATSGVAAAAVGGGVVLVRLAPRLAQRPALRGLAVLANGRRRLMVGALLTAVCGCQILRTLLVLHLAGFHASLASAVATFLVAGILSTLLVGPSAGAAGAPFIVFGHHHLAAAGVAGLMLSASALVAALVYAAVGGPVYIWQLRAAPRAGRGGAQPHARRSLTRVSGTSIR